jgi:hypothetical protein
VDRIDKVTKADIRRVANETFVDTNRTVGVIETAGGGQSGGAPSSGGSGPGGSGSADRDASDQNAANQGGAQ